MTLMRVLAKSGLVLTYDTDDIEHVQISTPHDFVETDGPNDTIHRKLTGTSHLNLSIDFKPGKRALWIEDEPAT